MAFSKITYRWRRRRGLRGKALEQRRGFWANVQNPYTWRLIVSVGLTIYKIYRLALKINDLFE